MVRGTAAAAPDKHNDPRAGCRRRNPFRLGRVPGYRTPPSATRKSTFQAALGGSLRRNRMAFFRTSARLRTLRRVPGPSGPAITWPWYRADTPSSLIYPSCWKPLLFRSPTDCAGLHGFPRQIAAPRVRTSLLGCPDMSAPSKPCAASSAPQSDGMAIRKAQPTCLTAGFFRGSRAPVAGPLSAPSRSAGPGRRKWPS